MRRFLRLIGILFFIWISMLFGLWLIVTLVLPLTIPVGGWFGRFLTSMARVVIGTSLAILWLWAWKKVEYAYLWRVLKQAKKEQVDIHSK